MTIQQLEYFICVAEEGNFSRASEKLYISRQALSHSIHELEDDLGCKLLIAGEKQVQLTIQGDILCEKGKKIVEQFKALEREITLASEEQLTVKVAISDTMLPNLAPDILKYLDEYSRLHPGVIERIDEVSNNTVLDCVEDTYDIGFYVGDRIRRKNLVTISYGTFPLRLTLPKTNSLSSADKITYEQISENLLIVPGDPKVYFKTLAKEFDAAGVKLNAKIISGAKDAENYLDHEADCICTDIPWPAYNTRLVQKQLQGSKATLSLNIAVKKSSSETVSTLQKYMLNVLKKT